MSRKQKKPSLRNRGVGRPPDLDKFRLVSPRYGVGYVERFQDARMKQAYLYTRIAGIRKTTGLLDHPDNYAQAIAILEQRQRVHLGIDAPEAGSAGTGYRTLFEVLHEYKQVKSVQGVSQALRRQFDQACFFFLSESENFRLDTEGCQVLRRIAVERIAKSPLKQTTKSTYLRVLRPAFDYAVQAGHAPDNPLRLVKVREPRKTTAIQILTPEQQQALLNYWAHRNPDIGNAFRFLLATGARQGEFLQLRTAEYLAKRGMSAHEIASSAVITADCIRIIGKGSRVRTIPVCKPDTLVSSVDHWMLDVYESVEHWRMVAGKYRGSTSSVHSSSYLRTLWTQSQQALGLPKGLSVHKLRATALSYWIDELQLPVAVIDAMGGNTRGTRERHYHATPETGTLLRKLREVSGR